MDKEILRIVIIATGLIIMLTMLVWAYIKEKKAQDELDFYEEADHPETSEAQEYEDFDIAPVVKPEVTPPNRYAEEPKVAPKVVEEEDFEPPPRPIAPAIIQFYILAKNEEGFNGIDLTNAFHIAGLEYGSLKIYERLDTNRLVDFGVASIAPPGTFPNTHLDDFYCPGLVFFMQPGVLDDPLSVFEDYIETIRMLAVELDGDILDHEHKPLSNAGIQAIRQSL